MDKICVKLKLKKKPLNKNQESNNVRTTLLSICVVFDWEREKREDWNGKLKFPGYFGHNSLDLQEQDLWWQDVKVMSIDVSFEKNSRTVATFLSDVV